MYCLGMFLPLIIGTLIQEDDKHWQLFCVLLDIIDIIFVHKTTVYSIGVLEGLIENITPHLSTSILADPLFPKCTTWFIILLTCFGTVNTLLSLNRKQNNEQFIQKCLIITLNNCITVIDAGSKIFF